MLAVRYHRQAHRVGQTGGAAAPSRTRSGVSISAASANSASVASPSGSARIARATHHGVSTARAALSDARPC